MKIIYSNVIFFSIKNDYIIIVVIENGNVAKGMDLNVKIAIIRLKFGNIVVQ